MKSLHIQNFFDLSDFAHKALFEACEYPWEAFPAIKEYLNGLSLGKIDVEIPEGAFLENPELISIGEGTIVEPGAFIKGPCVVGKGCSIRQGAYIRGNVVVGDHCVVGHATEAKNTVFLNWAQAGHFAYLGDSILGNHVNLGAGTKCANLKLDNGTVVLSVDGESVDTGLRKFGAVIGDFVQIGCNAVTNPGTIIGPRSRWYPCVNHGGIVPPNSIVKPAQKSQVVSINDVTQTKK
jgi:UDP-N-acetylglucosamine diphosphorylase / glucose-1-phosphate thymidylyltransferase / UDP-N-acetylgalactosamine diphosphorylase / glucosamine-1-phosphate N-acetyltransferase / galactosamine-1-phosphate N-acetyltransferase